MKQVAYLFLLVSVIFNYVVEAAVQADDDDRNALDNKINKCLFKKWKHEGASILEAEVDCNGPKNAELCYGSNHQALFAICYNKDTRIPEFSGYVVNGDPKASGRGDWKNEAGPYIPGSASEEVEDYDPYKQKHIVPNFDPQREYFYSRGHPTPNNIFHSDEERELTMINTNIAPQWQLFNAINWAILEKAVRSYSQNRGRRVYVVTGTGGALKDKNGDQLLINGRVVAPGYYWKAVCEPAEKMSVVFVAENPTSTSGKIQAPGCNNKAQTPDKGIINCYSLEELRGRPEAGYFNLPRFAAICNPAVRGTFLDNSLKGLK